MGDRTLKRHFCIKDNNKTEITEVPSICGRKSQIPEIGMPKENLEK
jgi:hypothetical protein